MGRQAFLSCMGAVYFCAFASYYVQYPGLLGTDGLEPTDTFLEGIKGQLLKKDPSATSPLGLYRHYPVLSWWVESLNSEGVADCWHVDDLHEAICLLGMALSLLAFLGVCRHGLLFLTLWASYLTLYKVGQTFYSFQWDILLLEVGFVTALYAPWMGRGGTKAPLAWVLRWVLFKLMLMAGVVKMQSRCPTWLRLTALEYHYATQCIPTPLAWFAHQLHPLLQRFSVASTLVIEIPATVLLLSPILSHRRVGAGLQVLLQVLIVLTGNYNFFNALTMALCIPVCASDWEAEDDAINDDESFSTGARGQVQRLDYKGPFVYLAELLHHLESQRWWSWLHCLAAWAAVGYSARSMITITAKQPALPHLEHVSIDLSLTVDQLDRYLAQYLPRAIWAAACLLALSCLVYTGQRGRRSCLSAFRAIGVSLLAMGLFAITAVPLARLHPTVQRQLPNFMLQWYQRSQPWSLSSGYGLFRTMTGVGRPDPQSRGWGDRPPSVVARPEVIIEGFDGQAWHELDFRYKPGCTTCRPRFVAPYQPRLDWQMWFAALGSYQHAPWLVHLVDKLLEGSQPVARLLDPKTFPPGRPPYEKLRARLYTYDLTRIDSPWSARLTGAALLPYSNLTTVQQYWQRSDTFREYLPDEFSRGNPSIKSFLKHHGWGDSSKDSTTADEPGACTVSLEGWKDVSRALSAASLKWVRSARRRVDSAEVLDYQYQILLGLLCLKLAVWRLGTLRGGQKETVAAGSNSAGEAQ